MAFEIRYIVSFLPIYVYIGRGHSLSTTRIVERGDTYRSWVQSSHGIIVLRKTCRCRETYTADGHIEFLGDSNPVRPGVNVRVGVICHVERGDLWLVSRITRGKNGVITKKQSLEKRGLQRGTWPSQGVYKQVECDG